jgi:hypothetical protein
MRIQVVALVEYVDASGQAAVGQEQAAVADRATVMQVREPLSIESGPPASRVALGRSDGHQAALGTSR